MQDFDTIIGEIYDCAANPELWPQTLTKVRDAIGMAYVMVGLVDMAPTLFGQPPNFNYHHSEWDRSWLMRLQTMTNIVPGAQTLLDGSIDKSWTQLEQLPREDFIQTQFYKEWGQPQGLTDCLNVAYLSRNGLIGLLSGAMFDHQGGAFNSDQCRAAERLSPHIRRAMVINDIVDKGKLAVTLYESVLGHLTTPVFLMGLGRQLVFANGAAETLLSSGNLLHAKQGAFGAHRVLGNLTALDEAIDRASKGDLVAGTTGIGVPLLGKDGTRAAAYVLPISGKDVRGAMGRGHCAIFVAKRGDQQPMAIEILRTIFDLTPSEARVTMMIAEGDGPQSISTSLDLSVNTIRTHLKHAFAKTGAGDQTELAALVHSLMPPVAAS